MTDIRTSVISVKKFVHKLKLKIDNYRGILEHVERYLTSTRNDKLLLMLRKLMEFLDNFVDNLMNNFEITLKVASNIEALNNRPLDKDQNKLKLFKITYNEQVRKYNKLILKFDSIRRKLTIGALDLNKKRLKLDIFHQKFKRIIREGQSYNLLEALRFNVNQLKKVGEISLFSVKGFRNFDFEVTPGRLTREQNINLAKLDSLKPRALRLPSLNGNKTYKYVCRPNEVPPVERVEIKSPQKSDYEMELDDFNDFDQDMRELKENIPLKSDKMDVEWTDDSSDSVSEILQELDERLSSEENSSNQIEDINDTSTKSINTSSSSDSSDSIENLPELPLDKEEISIRNQIEADYTSDESFSSSRESNNNKRIRKCCLLINANRNRKYYETPTDTFDLKHTCGFDSIIQILLANVIDHPNYITRLPPSILTDFILKLRTTSCSEASRLRDDFLVTKFTSQMKFESSPTTQEIDLFETIAGVWKKYLDDLPSAYRRYSCHPEVLEKKSVFEIVKIPPFESFSVEEELTNVFENEKFRCPKCSKVTETYFELEDHLFIDLNISDDQNRFYCKLKDFPQNLKCLGDKFRLAGVIEGASHHFIAYVRRSNGNWEQYDDLKEKVYDCYDSDVVAPEAIVYIRE